MTKIKNIAVALSAIVLFAGNSFAGTTSKPVNGIYYSADEPMAELMTVNYIGEDADYLFFEVSVKANSNKKVSFAVNDSEDGELYSTTFKADKKQTLKIEKRYNQQLDFSITAGNKSYSKSFTVIPTVTLEVASK